MVKYHLLLSSKLPKNKRQPILQNQQSVKTVGFLKLYKLSRPNQFLHLESGSPLL